MKKSFILLAMIASVLAGQAQAPESISYQTVARDNSGNLIANQQVVFRLSILQGGPSGTVVYSERHMKTTNQFGLATLAIGAGTVLSGNFSTINWGADTYYLQTEFDPDGGSNFQLTGTSQFLSVPYALYAKTAGSGGGGGGGGSSIADADNDTKVQTEKNPDEDIIRFDVGGTETMAVQAGRLELFNSKNSLFIGENTGISNATGINNAGLGASALQDNTSGTQNTAIGKSSMQSNTGGTDNTAIGAFSLYYNNNDKNTAVGSLSMYNNMLGFENTAIGYQTMYGHKSGRENTAVGSSALNQNETGWLNTTIGYNSLYLNKGSNNTVIGGQAGYGNVDGSGNTFLGYLSGFNNSGSYNVFIGNKAGFNESGSNRLYIGNSDTCAPLIGGDFSVKKVTVNGQLGVTGNVGIGTLTPQNKLHVVANTDPIKLEGLQNSNYTVYLVVDDYGVVSRHIHGAGLAPGWDLTGNNGIDTAVNFVGTLGPTALKFRVNHLRAGSIEPNSNNTSIGLRSIQSATTGTDNTAMGSNALASVTSGSSNTAIGAGALAINGAGDGNIALGKSAGYHETESNHLYIDNRFRGNVSAERTGSIIHGVMDDNASNQVLTLNAKVGIGTLTPTNQLHIVATSNPVRFEGLQPATVPDVLVVDANGVVSKRTAEGAYWLLKGNSGTNTAIDFVGTTDSISLNFKVNGKRSGTVDIDRKNTSFGYTSLNNSALSGSFNAAFGYKALSGNTTGAGNTSVGSGALSANTTGGQNTAVGKDAAAATTTGISNTAIGNGALYSNQANSRSTAIGYGALYYANDASSGNETYNTAVGYEALKGFEVASINTGRFNTAIGDQSLFSNRTGSNNTATGKHAMYSNTTGNSNTGFGREALWGNISGNNNTTIGISSLCRNETGNYNTVGGALTMYSNVAGDYNTAFGYRALGSNQIGSSNVALGNMAGHYETGNNKLYIDNADRGSQQNGYEKSLIYGIFDADPANQILALNAKVGVGTITPSNQLHVVASSNPIRLEGIQTTTNSDVLVTSSTGVVSKRSMSSLAGEFTWSVTGNAGTNPATNFIGTTDNSDLRIKVNNAPSGYIDKSQYNTSFGYYSMPVLPAAGSNTAFGAYSLSYLSIGGSNTAFGTSALTNVNNSSGNTAVGRSAMNDLTTGDNNTAVGKYALLSDRFGSNNVAVGNYAGAYEQGSNKLYIDSYDRGNEQQGMEKALLYGVFDATPANQILAVNAKVGIGTVTPTNKLHVISTSDPVRFEGLRSSSVDTVMVINNSGVVSKQTMNSLVSGTAWSLTGNSGTDPSENFIGTNDFAPLVIKVNTFKSGIIDLNNYNTSFGYLSLLSNTSSGFYNIALGQQALFNNTSGDRNIATGVQSLYENSTGNDNIAIGKSALYNNQGNHRSIAIGYHAMFYADNRTSGHETYNIALGYEALQGSTTPSENTGTYLTALGDQALMKNSAGFSNTAIGSRSLSNNVDGYSNTAVGKDALFKNIDGYSNTALGFSSGNENIGGDRNTAIGSQALSANENGSNNTAIGSGALFNTKGHSNVGIGINASFYSSSVDNIVAIGDSSLYLNQGSRNTAIGSKSLNLNQSGDDNTAIGYQSLKSGSAGTANTALGSRTLTNNYDGNYNTALGYSALQNNHSGSYNVAIGYIPLANYNDGQSNVAIGYAALGLNSTGDYNIGIGSNAGIYNQTGYGNIAIGLNSGPTSAGLDNTIAIGHNVSVDFSNRIVIGTDNNAGFYSKAIYNYITSNVLPNVYIEANGNLERICNTCFKKSSVKTILPDEYDLLTLNPVSYLVSEWGNSRHFGLLPDETNKVMPDLVVYKKAKEVAGMGNGDEMVPADVNYQELTVLLLKEIQNIKKSSSQQQETRIQQLEQQNAELMRRLEELEKRVTK